MCTLVETSDASILIDPGAALAPNRFGKPPHPKEWERLEEHLSAIRKAARKADALCVSHYHFDHHLPSEPEIWKGKLAFVKNPFEHANKSEASRGKRFAEEIRPLARRFVYCDGQSVKLGKTRISFSPALPHGQDAKLGYVVMACIDDGKQRFLHTGDVEGPPLEEQRDHIIKENPDVIFCDGPMAWMAYRYPPALTEKSVENLEKIISRTRVSRLVLDHHFMRELKWRERIPQLFSFVETENAKGRAIELLTAAAFAGKEDDLLEARRAELYREHPVKELRFWKYDG
jgi:predicted metallo-beta-lactamase superfamily hydrolase